MTDAGRYDAREVEVRLRRAWAETGLYRSSWRDAKDAKGARKTFVVDTPPPTVSGSLHIGHVFSYTHQDVLVRFHRMLGDGICYPMGWDDNGLPTERRVQNRFNIRCEPSRPYEPLLKPDPEAKAPRDVSRRNFIELCEALRVEDEAAFQDLWERIGLSVDWKETYATIDERCRRAAQRSFLEFHRAGHVYNTDAPHLWDVTFRTAVAQAEVEDREVDGHFHTLRFAVEGGGSFRIATTRPELLGACVAVAVHPADDRHRPLVGKRAVTPAYRARVPVVASDRVDREKGTGAVMVCTFGDSTDVQWWREFSLPLREVVGRDGRIRAVSYGTDGWDSASPDLANRLHAELAGLPVEKARKAVVALLSRPEASAEGGAAASPPIEGEPKPVRHAVKFYEKGDRPLELISTRQWYVKVLDKKEMLLAQGRKIRWVPEQMRTRYERWVEGLATDWCISRQRYFGVPFPLWYGADASGAADPGQVLLAPASSLPADPLASPPPGRREEERGKPGGFVGEADVLDTWFTSSLTPQIVSGWGDDPARHAALFPMDLRPQSH
ncbi:MAG: class I tRNA ligase family protein, partial [Planctomycetes bacterium]|nr:class I tRNA ligase family protein [Planctomycetota bacterium]